MGDYTDAVKTLRERGVRVEIWARRANASEDLISAANSVRYIDKFLTTPQAANPHLKVAA